MVTARIAGFSPGTSPPPVRIPITPFLVAMWAILHLTLRDFRQVQIGPKPGVGSAKVSVLTAATHRLVDTNLEARLGGFVLPSPPRLAGEIGVGPHFLHFSLKTSAPKNGLFVPFPLLVWLRIRAQAI